LCARMSELALRMAGVRMRQAAKLSA
jgi:hypothetical protein